MRIVALVGVYLCPVLFLLDGWVLFVLVQVSRVPVANPMALLHGLQAGLIVWPLLYMLSRRSLRRYQQTQK